MKATTISILVLVVFPIHLMAQESNDFKPKSANYYAKRYFEVAGPAKHIVDPTKQTNRSGSSSMFAEPVVVNSGLNTAQRNSSFQLAPASRNGSEFKVDQFKGGNFSQLEVKPLGNSFSAPSTRVAMAPTDFRINTSRAPYVVDSPIQDGPIEIASPEVDPGIGIAPSQIVRPTPNNSASGYLDAQPSVSDAPAVEAPAAPLQPAAAPRDTTYDSQGMGQSLLVAPEAVSLDHLRMSQRESGWEDRGSNTMRHITDHFSPGGEPFAQRGIVGDANFFGVDRRSCCDEWDFCNCSGGLKYTPGHSGIPWLRSKDSCDAVNPILGRHKAKKAAKCGCSQCASNDCGCGQ